MQKRLLWTQKGADLGPHPVAGLVVKVGDAEKFFRVLGFKGLDPFLTVRLLIPFSLAIAAIAEAILVRTSAAKVSSLHRVAPKYLKLVTSGRSC